MDTTVLKTSFFARADEEGLEEDPLEAGDDGEKDDNLEVLGDGFEEEETTDENY